MYYINSYSTKSKGAKALSNATGIPLLKDKDLHNITKEDVIFNWGKGKDLSDLVYQPITYNKNSGNFVNKSKFLAHIHGKTIGSSYHLLEGLSHPINLHVPSEILLEPPPGASTIIAAASYIGYKYLCNGGGNGVEYIAKGSPFSPEKYKLITKYFPKKYEIRVIVTEIGFLVLTKKIKATHLKSNIAFKIRSHKNGAVFSENIQEELLPYIEDYYILANNIRKLCQLSYCAVDFLIKSNFVSLCITEINTAPAIEKPATLKVFTDFLDAVKMQTVIFHINNSPVMSVLDEASTPNWPDTDSPESPDIPEPA